MKKDKNCFFCHEGFKVGLILDSRHFYSRYDDFPVSEGHAEIVTKDHTKSFFDLDNKYLEELFDLMTKTKAIVAKKYRTDGFNIGINEGISAGQTIAHLHIHLIPRFKGDVENPIGGIRNIFPSKADYVTNKSDKKVYNKLIRDKIPEIIEKSGESAKIYKLSKTDFKKELAKKILEEGKELCEAKSSKDILNELSDLLELVYAIAEENKLSLKELGKNRVEKNLKRGGFEKRLFLEYVEEK